MIGSKIGWTDDTLNFWWGCVKVSPACKHCYADVFSNRVGKNGLWGPPQTSGRLPIKSALQTLSKIRALAITEQKRRRVFCQSMGDIFEEFPVGVHENISDIRRRAFSAMERSPELDFLLLTKRPENILDMVPSKWLKTWPQHILVGASAESQDELESRLPFLLQVPTRRFLSCEPLLGSLDFIKAFSLALGVDFFDPGGDFADPDGQVFNDLIHWVIVGGESGTKKSVRPTTAGSVRDVLYWCEKYNVPFFFKQWGRYLPACQVRDNIGSQTTKIVAIDGLYYADMGSQKDFDLLDGDHYHNFYSDVAPIITIVNE